MKIELPKYAEIHIEHFSDSMMIEFEAYDKEAFCKAIVKALECEFGTREILSNIDIKDIEQYIKDGKE